MEYYYRKNTAFFPIGKTLTTLSVCLSVSQGEAELQSCGRVSMYERAGLHFLEIQEVGVEDAGSYTCLVTNSAGTATATAALSVQGEATNHSSGSFLSLILKS